MKTRITALALSALLALTLLSACKQETVVPPASPSAPAPSASAPAPESTKKPVADFTAVFEAPAMSVTDMVKVEVSFAANKLTSVKVVEHDDTVPIMQTVIDLLIPRILDAQSLEVDSITGATMSSVGVKTAIAQAIDANGGDSKEWYTPVEKKNDVVTLEGFDVIVVGLGGGGMTAYLAAAQGGATVFGIEAAGKVGGNSAVAGGPMTVNPKSKMESENNGQKFLDEEELIADWNEYTRGDAKEDIIRLFVEESGYTVDWLTADYDFKFMPVKPFFHPKQFPVVSNYADENYQDDDALDLHKTPMFQAAIDKAKGMNAKNDYMLELRATDLILDGDKIVGVQATYYDGTTYKIYGDSVILATGGFIGDRDLKLKYFGSNYRTDSVLQDDGAGIKMALAQGAGTYNIEMPAIVHISQLKNIIRTDELTLDQKAAMNTLLQKADSLIVGQSGRRFVNESAMFGIAFDNWKDGGYFYAIYSDDMLEQIKNEGVKQSVFQMFLSQGMTPTDVPISDMDKILEVGEAFGNVVRAQTLEELAQKLGTPALVETVAEYNTYAAGTPDPLGKAPELIHAIGDGPYTAILGAGYYYGTSGGLDIDANMRVLKADGTPFDNLYAVGQDSMGVLFTEKEPYSTYGGVAQGWTITSGRLAGTEAAKAFK